MNWLDTETKAILQKEQESKFAPSKAAEFGLVLLRKGRDRHRLVRAIRRINDCGEAEGAELADAAVPVTINPGLTEPEALFGQFELICCDAVAPFLRSEVLLEQTDRSYLDSLFQKVLQSPEFELAHVEVLAVPATESGQKFLDQFLGISSVGQTQGAAALSVWVPFKKARIMRHWATRVGAELKCEAAEGSSVGEDLD